MIAGFEKSQPQSLVTLTATLDPDDYKVLGFQPTSQQPQSVGLSAMADTGCQSCLASTTVLQRLGLNQKDLIPVTNACMLPTTVASRSWVQSS